MINTSLRFAIRALVDVTLPDWHPTRALYIGIDCRMDDPDTNIYGASGSLHIIVQKVSNYLTVWIVCKDKVFPYLEHVKSFGENVCHHDSCWINSIDSAATEMYFKLAKKTNPEKPPVQLDHRFNIHRAEVINITTERVERGIDRRWIIRGVYKVNPADDREGSEVLPEEDR